MTQTLKPKIVLIGGGGHCSACIDVIESEGKFSIVGIVDKDSSVKNVCGYPCLGDDRVLSSLATSVVYALITVGQIESPAIRMQLLEQTKALGFTHPTIVSPRAYVSRHATLGKGTIVMHDALINANAKIGEGCIINSKALIEHDAIIGNHCHISTAAVINGGAVIGGGCFVGSNATIIEKAETGENAFIKAGSLFVGVKNA